MSFLRGVGGSIWTPKGGKGGRVHLGSREGRKGDAKVADSQEQKRIEGLLWCTKLRASAERKLGKQTRVFVTEFTKKSMKN